MVSFKRPQMLLVEGNIGAGKSTFLKMIGEYLDVQLVYEPHERWQQVGDGENLLDKFYQDTNRWAYTFQTYAFVTRVVEQESFQKSNTGKVQVLERSVYSDRYCFARNCYELGSMTALEWQLYQDWFGWLVETYTTKPTGFIYLKTDPEICYERMCKRNRSEESSVSFSYIKSLHDKHEDWLVKKLDIAPYLQDVPVLTLECNNDFEHDTREQERHVTRIMEFFKMLPIAYKTPQRSTTHLQV